MIFQFFLPVSHPYIGGWEKREWAGPKLSYLGKTGKMGNQVQEVLCKITHP